MKDRFRPQPAADRAGPARTLGLVLSSVVLSCLISAWLLPPGTVDPPSEALDHANREASAASPRPLAATQTFADVPPDHPYYQEIEALFLAGYTAGCGTDPLRYCPDQTMNRAESAVFVERGIHNSAYVPPQPTAQVFADVPLDSWSSQWVDGLWKDRYTAGCGINPLVFCPWQGHTRAEGAVFYLRMLHGATFTPEQPTRQIFADVPLDTWYAKWAQAAIEAGLIPPCQGTPEPGFCPNDPLSRGLAAYMMVQARGLIPAEPFTISEPNQDTFRGVFQGFGAEWDPFFWNAFGQSQGLNQADWDIITSRIKEMHVPLIRMWMQLYFALRDPDLRVWDYNNARMQSVFKYLDFACQNDIDVILTDWGWSFWYSYGFYNGDPTDYRFAQAIAEYLKEFIDRRGYTCIKYLIVGNEPDYEIVPEKGLDPYVGMIRNIDRALRENGLRDRIKLVGPDAACCQGFFSDSVSALHDVFDVYDFHLYSQVNPSASSNFWYELDKRRDWVYELTDGDPVDSAKMMFVTEAGNSDFPKESWEYAIHMADYGTTLLTTRLQGAAAWTMHDIYYDQGHDEFEDNSYMPWGMWDYKDGGWALRPWSQTWGLLIRFAPRGSIQAAVNGTPPQTPPNSPYRLGAVKRPDGGWSLFLVNRANAATNVRINLPGQAEVHRFATYRVERGTLGAHPNEVIPPAEGILTAGSTFTVSLPANSFTVLVEEAAGLVTPSIP